MKNNTKNIVMVVKKKKKSLEEKSLQLEMKKTEQSEYFHDSNRKKELEKN